MEPAVERRGRESHGSKHQYELHLSSGPAVPMRTASWATFVGCVVVHAPRDHIGRAETARSRRESGPWIAGLDLLGR